MGFKRKLKGEVIWAGERWEGAEERREVYNVSVSKEKQHSEF